MRYIKKFENNYKFKIGDIVFYNPILGKQYNYYKQNPGEIVGYDISLSGEYYEVYFYNLIPELDFDDDKIIYIDFNDGDMLLRKATPKEILKYKQKKEEAKYNL